LAKVESAIVNVAAVVASLLMVTVSLSPPPSIVATAISACAPLRVSLPAPKANFAAPVEAVKVTASTNSLNVNVAA